MDTQRWLTRFTKIFLDFMFWAGIAVTVTLPWGIRFVGQYITRLLDHYYSVVAVYFILGLCAEIILWELRKIFGTVIAHNCFVKENVNSLQRMGTVSFVIVLFSLVRILLYPTMAMLVVVLVFVVAGLFSKVLAMVFEEAVNFKEDNDLTI